MAESQTFIGSLSSNLYTVASCKGHVYFGCESWPRPSDVVLTKYDVQSHLFCFSFK